MGVAALTLAGGCGGERDDVSPGSRSPAGDSREQTGPADRRDDRVERARCPTGLESCRSAEGRIVFVEPVDPDGDGDAHFAIVDPQGITGLSMTAIDVRKGLRPHPLPEVGDVISAAGPVQTGSYGQRQIHALELHVAGE